MHYTIYYRSIENKNRLVNVVDKKYIPEKLKISFLDSKYTNFKNFLRDDLPLRCGVFKVNDDSTEIAKLKVDHIVKLIREYGDEETKRTLNRDSLRT